MRRGLDIVLLGLSLSSSWGNGHATTYRALLQGLHRLGHRTLFLERDVPWYAANRDLPSPGFCELALYQDRDMLARRHGGRIAAADAVIVGSYVPEGIAVVDDVLSAASGTVAFYDIDTPVTLAQLSRGEETYIARRQIPMLDAYFSFTGGPMLRRLETEFGARLALPLYCSVDARMYRPRHDPPSHDLGYLGTYSADRQPALERLLIEPARRLPGMRFVVAGSGYPDTIDWPANVERIAHLAPGEHPGFYGRQRYTLNVTRADMVAAGWSPSVRLFEAAACGTPIISDVWAGIGELFPPGRAILLARSADDVVAALTCRTAVDRTAMAVSARRIVLAEHTGTVRAGELADRLMAITERRGGATKHREGVSA